MKNHGILIFVDKNILRSKVGDSSIKCGELWYTFTHDGVFVLKLIGFFFLSCMFLLSIMEQLILDVYLDLFLVSGITLQFWCWVLWFFIDQLVVWSYFSSGIQLIQLCERVIQMNKKTQIINNNAWLFVYPVR
jgi:hypothetical protein